MEDSFFGLLRYFLRVDGVMLRLFDTRFYHRFGSDSVLREFAVRENSVAELQARGYTVTHSPL
jgi:type 2A phosphatase activator TIP41